MNIFNIGGKPEDKNQVVTGKKKILIVDDDKYILDFYKELLESEGYETLTAERGQQSIDMTFEKNPNLILLDIMMPEMDGMTVFSILKEKGVTTPVIFLTNAGDTTNLLQAAKEAAAGFLIKSDIEPEYLLQRIKEVLSGNSSKISDFL